MIQLNDLSDDCLLEVLNWLSPNELFKMQRINRRMKRLAGYKMGVKIKAIAIKGPKRCLTRFSLFSSKCSHFDAISPDQVLVFNFVTFMCQTISLRPLSLWSKCSGVKSIDFDNSNYRMVLNAFERCPQLECVKLRRKFVNQEECDRVLDKIGQRIVHLAFDWQAKQYNALNRVNHRVNHRFNNLFNQFDNIFNQRPFVTSDRFLETVAVKCPNIKRIDWVNNDYLSDFMAKFKLLSKSCWIRLVCYDLVDGVAIDDVIDELEIEHTLNWSQLGHRYDRLSKLKLNIVKGPDHGVEFNGLKRLEFNEIFPISRQLINRLLVSRFPKIKEFGFSASAGYTEDHYEGVFQQMASVKKLAIKCGINWLIRKYQKLPQSAIHKLKKLETIDLIVLDIKDEWHPSNFLQQVEQYVDGIESLKKVTIDIHKCENDVWNAAVYYLVKRLKLKQSKVKVILVDY